MTDNISPQDRKRAMQAVKSTGTSLERRAYSLLAGMKIKGWAKNPLDILGKPDIIWRDKKVAIFIDGCFWHGCSLCGRRMPATNAKYWKKKIDRNIKKAKEVNKKLCSLGWVVIRIWEHELVNLNKKDNLKARLRRVLMS